MNSKIGIAVALSALLLLGGVAFLVVTLKTWTDRDASHSSPFSKVGEPLWETPDFDLVNCDGRSVSKADLAGKVWVAAFIFTRCPGPCPLITRRMSEVQRRLADDREFRLVSFTVDPAYDTPDVLLRYAQARGADPKRWYFLTGRDDAEETMHRLANDFKVAASKLPPEEGAETSEVPNIVHGTNILLVDQTGWVRAIFDSEDPESVRQIAEAVARLEAGR